jgi:uncharacterized protein (TIGR03086 family)
MAADIVDAHRRACDDFAAVTAQGDGRWDRPSPCTEWDGRGVVEHVIGFHEVLVLRPLEVKAGRPREGPHERWLATRDAIMRAIAMEAPATEPDLANLLPMLTQDVLVHTWDLARTIGADDRLDPNLVGDCYGRLVGREQALRASGMFGDAVPVHEGASIQNRLLGLVGRDPAWSPPI